MASTTRKQRELEAREQLILDVAERLVGERGYLGMNMDLIAQATEYSKGTIYQHFSSKEEVLTALTERMAKERVRLFEKAATFQGRPRERMAAVGLSFDLFAMLYPTYVHIEQIVTADSIRAKATERRLDSLQVKEVACLAITTGLVRDGIAAGDLVLPPGTTPEGLVMGLWMITYGGLSLIAGKPDLAPPSQGHPFPGDPSEILRRNQNAILDGYGWRPLTDEWDYEATRRRALTEVFPDEAHQAGLL